MGVAEAPSAPPAPQSLRAITKTGTTAVIYTKDYGRAILLDSLAIPKRTKSKNRMQITEFPARLGQQKSFLRKIQGM